MSGTSLDGIDVAVVEMPRIRTLAFRSTPYPEAVRAELLDLAGKTTQAGMPVPQVVERLSKLNYQLAELYAKAIGRLGPVDLIGCHGQTVYHEGGRHTLQLGEAAVIAERTG